MSLHSAQIERQILGGLVKHPEVYADVSRFIQDKDFYHPVHQSIFAVLKSLILSGEQTNKTIVAQKIKNLGISFKDEVGIFDYVESIAFTQIQPKAIVEASRELVKLRVLRELAGDADASKAFIFQNRNEPLDKIIAGVDGINSRRIEAYSFDQEPIDLTEGIEEEIERRGNSPTEEIGLRTPYANFNRLYGGFRGGNIYAIASRPKQGKTTWITDTVEKMAKINDIKVLMLDTEMATQDIQFRNISAKTGVPMWWLETGNWRKNEEYTRKVREHFKQVKKSGVDHMHVANRSMDEICSIARRWYLKNVGRGNKCIICYDYIKMTVGDEVTKNWAEYQAMGQKVDILKRLAEELDCPVLTAIQLNRSGENNNNARNMTLVDNSSAIAITDRLQWYGSFVGIFRRKTMEEMALDTENFGTHKLIVTAARFQGKDAAGHHDLHQRLMPNGELRWVENYVNFKVENFSVEECGTLENIITAQNEQHNVQDTGELRDDETV